MIYEAAHDRGDASPHVFAASSGNRVPSSGKCNMLTPAVYRTGDNAPRANQPNPSSLAKETIASDLQQASALYVLSGWTTPCPELYVPIMRGQIKAVGGIHLTGVRRDPHQCSAADRHGRFAPGRSRLVGCPRRLGGSGGSFLGRRLAMRSWKRIGSWATASSSTR